MSLHLSTSYQLRTLHKREGRKRTVKITIFLIIWELCDHLSSIIDNVKIEKNNVDGRFLDYLELSLTISQPSDPKILFENNI